MFVAEGSFSVNSENGTLPVPSFAALAPPPNAGVALAPKPVDAGAVPNADDDVPPPPKRLPPVDPKAGLDWPKRPPVALAALLPNAGVELVPPNPPNVDPEVAAVLPPPKSPPLLVVAVAPKPVLF